MSSGPRKLRSNSTVTRAPPTKPSATSRRAPTQASGPASPAATAEDAAATAAAIAMAAASTAATAAAAAPTMPPTPTKPGGSNPNYLLALSNGNKPTKSPTHSASSSPTSSATSTPSTSGRSSADSSATLRSTSSNPELFKYTVQNIPQAFATQKKFFDVLTTHLLLNDIDTLKVNYNKSCLLITRNEIPASFENRLRVATSDARISIKPINRPKKIQNPAKKSPLFSIVIKDVDHDIEERDILISAPHLKVHKMWRIISRKTNKPTPLIRLISDDVITIDSLLTDGIVLFGRLHRCEPSNAPPPTPVQCAKCFTLGHQASECSQKPICPRCTGTHAPNKCPKEDPECPFCKGPHPAWSRKCPEFHKLTVTDETQTLPTIIIDPPTEFADPVDVTDEAPEEINLSQVHAKALIAFVTKTLFDLLPLNRPKTQQAIQDASLAIFNLKTRINHSGRLIHFTFDA
ncbi:hypothetical protein Zmor_028398 [Zophobas morio]|uniref:Gag-like protein n=1 Tax=Zophobas morio TaxID=2755281 RepID=A0AA38HQ97_9CUCU|nr:hypothetical protein Zmor_028398 [Zophobas morio]